jgi:aminoglycoside 3-N-acetyltransferase
MKRRMRTMIGGVWRSARQVGQKACLRVASTMRRFRVRVNRVFYRVSAREIEQSLCVLKVRANVLLMHSSLSSCGYVKGGAAEIVRCVSARCETMVVPTHSYCYPIEDGSVGPLFDVRETPSVVGAVTEWFRHQPKAVRSVHPSHSVAASGPEANALVSGHELCDTPCGKGTPYSKLIGRDAGVLMFGVSLNTYTLFHTAEDEAACPYLYFPRKVHLRARGYDGVIRDVVMWRQNMSVVRKFAAIRSDLERVGLVRSTRLGCGTLLWLPSALRVHEFVVDRCRVDPFYLVARSARKWLEKDCRSQ